MGNILYETEFKFELPILIPFILLIAAFAMPKMKEKAVAQNDIKTNKEFEKVFMIIFRIFCVFMILIELVIGTFQYKNIVLAYRNGNYQTVEGYVENYTPMPYGGHSEESFTINGVEFAYSDFIITQGYHNAASHGGVITHNGQHLKLGYVEPDASNGNIIVYIEELP